MRRSKPQPSYYKATVYPDGRWYVERKDRIGYDYVTNVSVASGTRPTAASAERAARDAITNDKAKCVIEAQSREPLKTFTVDVEAVTTIPITTGIPRPTQTGAINAALILCPRECHKNHIARCPVCAHLESALREIR